MLNIKSEYTLLSSLIKVEDIITYAKKNNKLEIAIADSNMYCAMKFKELAEKNNIKPIFGLNVKLEDLEINLYAKSFLGYKNLVKICTLQNSDMLKRENLKEYCKDLVCVLYFKSISYYIALKKIYEDLYIGYSNTKEEKEALLKTENVVFFRECLYLNQDDYKYLGFLYLIRDGKKISDNVNYDLRNKNLIEENINDYTDRTGLINEEKIMDMCNVIFPKKENYLPIYEVPNNMSQKEYLYSLSEKGLYKRLNGNVPDNYKKRLLYELNIISEMGFINYFLIVFDFIAWAKKHDILVGPGRGSAAGSLVAYCLGITEIDPIKYDLLFERFLNPERKTMPDIDTDFPDDKREEVIEYVKNKYGIKKVAGIAIFGTLASKQVLRDVGRVLNIPLYKIDSLTKLITDTKKSLKEIYIENINFKTRIESDDTLKRLFEISIRLEGLPRHVSSHAAGTVMTRINLDEMVPLTLNDDIYLTSYSSSYLEDLGFLKMDFLGLRNLTIISNIIKDVNRYYNKNINFYKIPLTDPRVLKIFETGDTTGIFQFESAGMKNFLRRLKPNSFEDIFASIALYRPGPSHNIETYIKRKHKEEKVVYPDSSLESVLKNTYGIFIYQEQIMMAANVYAGYSLGEADILRRAMSKKKLDILKEEEVKFIDKATKLGRNPKTTKYIYDNILSFAGYGFNRSHSVAYSTIAYRLAFFKTYYKEIFYKNLLGNVIGSSSKTHEYIMEAKSKGIGFMLPDINISEEDYAFYDNKIYLPFSVVKNVGVSDSNIIIDARKNKFEDIYDAFSKLVNKGLGKKSLESLIYIDAFRSFNLNIKTLINNFDNLYNYATLTKDLDYELVMKPEIKKGNEFDSLYLLEKQKELIGFYLSGHPSSKYRNDFKNTIYIKDIPKYLNRTVATIIYVESIKKIKTKKGDDMAFITGSDETGNAEYTLFPSEYKNYDIKIHSILKINGVVERRLEEYQIIIKSIDKLR